MKKRKVLVISLVLISMLIASAFLARLIYNKVTESRKVSEKQKPLIKVLQQLSTQKAVDEKLRAELDKGSHSFEKPLIVLDPYGVSPLTAVIIFATRSPSRITVHIKGKDDAESGLRYTFNGYHTKHLIPVYGLYADVENKILIEAKDNNGGIQNKHLTIRTDKLHLKLEKIRVDILKFDKANTQSGFTFLYESTPKFAFDSNGDLRWILDLPTLQATLYNYKGHLIVASGSYHYGPTLLYEIDLLGRIYSISSSPYGVHHDITQISGGKLLITGSDGGHTIEDFIYELDLSTGMIGAALDFKIILDPGRPSMYRTDEDWLHLNTVAWSEGDSSIIVSGRHQSAVVKLTYPEGKIKWILGNHDNWLPEYAKYLLTPKGRHFEWQYVQHEPIISQFGMRALARDAAAAGWRSPSNRICAWESWATMRAWRRRGCAPGTASAGCACSRCWPARSTKTSTACRPSTAFRSSGWAFSPLRIPMRWACPTCRWANFTAPRHGSACPMCVSCSARR